MLYIYCGSTLGNFELEDVQDFLAAFSDLSFVMPSLSMFSSLLHSKDKLSWLPVVLLRQTFLLCLIKQHHTRGNEGGRIVFPKAIAGTKITHTGSSMSLLWKTGFLFSCSTFCHLLYSCFPFCPLYFCLAALSSTSSISLCFHLLFLYTLNPRQSVLTGVFCLIPWETSVFFLFPSEGFFLMPALVHLSQLQASLSSSQARSW